MEMDDSSGSPSAGKKAGATTEMRILWREMGSMHEEMGAFEESGKAKEKELLEEEQCGVEEKEQLKTLQQKLGAAKDRNALQVIEFEDMMLMEKTADFSEQTSVLDISATGTEADVEQFERQIAALREKKATLEAEMNTLHNDHTLMKSEMAELDESIEQLSRERTEAETQLPHIEQQIGELQQQKALLTEQFDELRMQLAAKELERRPTITAERGNSGLAEYDDYVKKIRRHLLELRDQKRGMEVQHAEISQRLDAKRRALEMADKKRVSEKTVELAHELSKQSSFLRLLKTCLDDFFRAHNERKAQIKADLEAGKKVDPPAVMPELLERICAFRLLCERLRKAGFAVEAKATPALHAEKERMAEQQRQISGTDAHSEKFREVEEYLSSIQTPFNRELLAML
ncbi:hypothetical protein M3Y99_01479100 [Aphelenchoides fujianensis]|nr:hypothetical protein M3Y99_01479100 [Aphelenchoides fujianensis]